MIIGLFVMLKLQDAIQHSVMDDILGNSSASFSISISIVHFQISVVLLICDEASQILLQDPVVRYHGMLNISHRRDVIGLEGLSYL